MCSSTKWNDVDVRRVKTYDNDQLSSSSTPFFSPNSHIFFHYLASFPVPIPKKKKNPFFQCHDRLLRSPFHCFLGEAVRKNASKKTCEKGNFPPVFPLISLKFVPIVHFKWKVYTFFFWMLQKSNTRKDAAVDAMKPYGFPLDVVQTTIKELLNVSS